MFKKFLTTNPQYANEEGYCIKSVLYNTDVAFLHESTRLMEIQKIYCQQYSLMILKDRIFPGYFTLAFQKNSDLTLIISSE